MENCPTDERVSTLSSPTAATTGDAAASDGASQSRVLVTLCTYNERDNLAALIADIHGVVPHAGILVVDDNSPDGTGRLADELAAADARVHVLHRPAKAGLGRATVAGFRWGIERDYDWLINMDADFSHPPKYLPDLLARTGEADVVIASRYVPGGGVIGWPLHRQLMSRAINAYARCMLGLSSRDNSGSYRCYRVAKLRELPLDAVRAAGYAIQEELLYLCRRAACRFVEVPFLFDQRRHGDSKITLGEAFSALWVLFRLRIGRAGQ